MTMDGSTEREPDDGSELDLIVIGGGVDGVGVAQDAAARGLRTALVEPGDFGAGASVPVPTVLAVGRAADVAERSLLAGLAPGLLRWTPFISIEARGEPGISSVGARWREWLAGTSVNRRRRSVGAGEVLETAPGLRDGNRVRGVRHWECVSIGSRFVVALARDAQSRGAQLYNYVAAEEISIDSGRVTGARLVDRITGRRFELR